MNDFGKCSRAIIRQNSAILLEKKMAKLKYNFYSGKKGQQTCFKINSFWRMWKLWRELFGQCWCRHFNSALGVITVWVSRAIRWVIPVLTGHELILQLFHLVSSLAGIFIEHVAWAFNGAETKPDVITEGATIIPSGSVVSLLQTIEFVVQQDNNLASSLELLVGLLDLVDDVTRLLVVGCVVHVVCVLS